MIGCDRGSIPGQLNPSEGQRGRGFVVPECLNGREDLLLMTRQGDAHSQEVAMETHAKYIYIDVLMYIIL